MGIFDIRYKTFYNVLPDVPAIVCEYKKFELKGENKMIQIVEEVVAKKYFEEEFASLTAKKEKIEIAEQKANQEALAKVAEEFVDVKNNINALLNLCSIIVPKEVEVAEVAQGE